MKKISSALLLVLVLASANVKATIKEHAKNNWGKYTTATVTLAALGSAIYCDSKYNDAGYLKKAKELVKNNPKAAAGIIAGVALTSGLGIDLSKSENSYAKKASNATINGVTTSTGYVKNKAVEGKNKVKGWFTRETKPEAEVVVETPEVK